MNKTLSLTGVVLLVLIASALVILGIALLFVAYDSSNPRDKSVPLDGFLLATLGIALSVVSWRLAAKLGATKPVETISGVVFSYFGIPALLGLIISVWYKHHWPTGLPPSGLILFALGVVETQVALAWLILKDRRARKAAASNSKIA